MLLFAQIAVAIVLLIHVYIVLLETVFFDTRGRRVFGLSAEKAAIVKPAMSNQGCYNGFLVAALAVGLLHGEPAVCAAFITYGLLCVAVAGIWGGLTVSKRIIFVQTVPAVLALVLYRLA
jgi:putative membrane protein